MTDSLDHIRNVMRSRPPKDTVRAPLDRDAILELNRLAGARVTVTEPGELVTDVDGLPLTVGPSTVEHANVGPAVLPLSILERAGVHPDEVPALHIIGRKNQ